MCVCVSPTLILVLWLSYRLGRTERVRKLRMREGLKQRNTIRHLKKKNAEKQEKRKRPEKKRGYMYADS